MGEIPPNLTTSKPMKKRFLIPAVCLGGLFGLAALGTIIDKNDIANCNSGDLTACGEVMEHTQDQITNKEWLAAKAEEKATKAKAEKARKERWAKTNAETKAANAKWRAEREARGEWQYNSYSDSATGKKQKLASLTSKNAMNFGFPYSGTQYGTFSIRNHPRYGVDAYLSIREGQLLCDNYSNTTVLVRFDDGPASAYSCNEPADHSNTTVFIEGVGRLESGIKNAKKMYVTVSVYQEGSRTWEFNVNGYDRSKV